MIIVYTVHKKLAISIHFYNNDTYFINMYYYINIYYTHIIIDYDI